MTRSCWACPSRRCAGRTAPGSARLRAAARRSARRSLARDDRPALGRAGGPALQPATRHQPADQPEVRSRSPWPFRSGRCRAATPGRAARSGRRPPRRWSPARTAPAASRSCRTPRARTAASTTASRSSRSERRRPCATVTPPPPRRPIAGRSGCRRALGVEIDAELLERALTHRSYAYEHGGLPHNERLEFLGDSVLGIVITETLYRTHPDLPEGKLAKLRASVVNMRALAEVAAEASAARTDSARTSGSAAAKRSPAARQGEHPGRHARGRARRGLPRARPDRRRTGHPRPVRPAARQPSPTTAPAWTGRPACRS